MSIRLGGLQPGADNSELAKSQGPRKGKKLEKEIAREAKKFGWEVKERRKHGRNIQDLILKKNALVLVVQLKNTEVAGPKDVSQAKKDYEEYLVHLIREELGIKVGAVLVSHNFSDKARKRARSYSVMLYRVDEFKKLLRG